MLSNVADLCLMCKELEKNLDPDVARETRIELADKLHDIMAEANSEIEISPKLFERHFQLTNLRADLETKCFECREGYKRQGGLIATQIDAYLITEIRAKTKLELAKSVQGNKVVAIKDCKNKKIK